MILHKSSLSVLIIVILLWEISVSLSSLATTSSIRKSHRVLRSIFMKDIMTFTTSQKNGGRKRILIDSSLAATDDQNNQDSSENQNGNINSNTTGTGNNNNNNDIGKLEALKQLEAELSTQLAAVRQEKLKTIQSRPLTIGIIGFGRFGQFIAKTFCKYTDNVIVTSRSDYSTIAKSIGATYVPLSDPELFLEQQLDVIVIAVSIVSFDSTIQTLAPYLQKNIERQQQQQPNGTIQGPLIVDVLSVKEHPRNIMLQNLPIECDILCTHPMFGPDSGKDSWRNLNFVYERTRINKVVLSQITQQQQQSLSTTSTTLSRNTTTDTASTTTDETFVDEMGHVHSIHEDSEAHVEGMDRIERFLSIWEEEGCHMVPLSCHDHDAYAANSQFITHLIGRVLGSQGLTPTPIDTSGFQSVLKLVDTTTADSFDLFYGLYKYNQNSYETIKKLQTAMEDVVQNLQIMEEQERPEA